MYGLGNQMTGRNNNQTDEGGETGTEKGESVYVTERQKKFRNPSLPPNGLCLSLKG